MTAETVAKTFAERWVAIFGEPSTITTDRGTHSLQISSLFLAQSGFVQRLSILKAHGDSTRHCHKFNWSAVLSSENGFRNPTPSARPVFPLCPSHHTHSAFPLTRAKYAPCRHTCPANRFSCIVIRCPAHTCFFVASLWLFRVVHGGMKTFFITKSGNEDRLKPAYLEKAENVLHFHRPTQDTRPGRDIPSAPWSTVKPPPNGHPRNVEPLSRLGRG